MSDEYASHVTCPKCSHDRNLSTYKKCEICGEPLKGYSGLPLVGLGVAALLLLGGGTAAWYFLRPKPDANVPPPVATSPTPQPTPTQPPVVSTPVPNTAPSATPPPATVPPDVAAAISAGDRVLFDSSDPAKLAAVAAFQQGDFASAIAQLEALRQKYRNDPEILLYLNNARVGTAPAVTAAVVTPISDTPGAAQEILRGVAHLQDEYNANRGSNLPIRIVVADDRNDPERAKAIAQALAADSTVTMVIGHGTSTTSLAAAPIYEQNQLVMVAPTSTSTELSQIGPSDRNYLYRTIPSDQLTGTALARYALQSFKQVALFYNSESSYSNSLKTAFTSTLSLEGGQVVAEIDLAKEDGLSRLSSLSADAIVLLPDSKTFERAITIAKANNDRIPIIAGDAMYRIETLQQAGKEMQGAVLPAAWHRDKSSDPSFPERAASLWGGDVNWRTALSYDAARVLEALVQTGAKSRANMATRLAAGGVTATGVTGAITFLPSGDRNGQVVLVKIESGTRSKTGFDFVPLE